MREIAIDLLLDVTTEFINSVSYEVHTRTKKDEEAAKAKKEAAVTLVSKTGALSGTVFVVFSSIYHTLIFQPSASMHLTARTKGRANPREH